MKLKQYFQTKKKLIDQRLVYLIGELEKDAERKSALGKETLKRMGKIAIAGKSLRGGLVFLSAEMYGFTNQRILTDVACGLELIHTSLLIHDDIMDNDRIRRGQPSFFAEFQNFAQKEKFDNPLLFGQSIAISIGDVGFFAGLKIIKNFGIINKICEELSLVGLGQMDDVYFGNLKKNPTEKEIINLYLYKTARYTFFLPMAVGAIIAGQKEAEMKKLEALGENLGIIFQISDDLLPFYSTKKEMGKPPEADIRNNKKTLGRIFLYQKASSNEKKFLDSMFGNTKVSIDDFNKIKQLFFDYKIDKQLYEISQKMIKKNQIIIKRLGVESKYQKTLLQLTDFFWSRKK